MNTKFEITIRNLNLFNTKIISKYKVDLLKIGELFFSIGIFFLPSAPFFSGLFLFPALLISFIKNKNNYFRDSWNYPFLFCTFLMIINSFIIFTRGDYTKEIYDQNLAFIGLLNWIPYFFCFWGFQIYLSSIYLRQRFILLIISGSVPVVIMGLSQYFFNLHGPFSIFNGLIIWYQRPLTFDSGITSIFNNANYASSFLNIILPLSIALTIKNLNKGTKYLISILITFSITITTILTFSRNGLLNILLTLIFYSPRIKRYIYIIIFIFCFTTLSFLNREIFPIHEKSLLLNLSNTITNLNFGDFISSPRYQIWDSAINFIKEKKLLGWGSASFPSLLELNKADFIAQHVHNMPLDLALSFGIPLSLILNFTLYFLLYKSCIIKKKFKLYFSPKDNSVIDMGWKISVLIFLLSQLFDLTYFDVRIGLLSWLLFAGLRNIIKENGQKFLTENN